MSFVAAPLIQAPCAFLYISVSVRVERNDCTPSRARFMATSGPTVRTARSGKVRHPSSRRHRKIQHPTHAHTPSLHAVLLLLPRLGTTAATARRHTLIFRASPSPVAPLTMAGRGALRAAACSTARHDRAHTAATPQRSAPVTGVTGRPLPPRSPTVSPLSTTGRGAHRAAACSTARQDRAHTAATPGRSAPVTGTDVLLLDSIYTSIFTYPSVTYVTNSTVHAFTNSNTVGACTRDVHVCPHEPILVPLCSHGITSSN